MNRRALLVGIDAYDHIQPALTWCVDDALAMREALAFHANYDPNFATRVLLGSNVADSHAPRVTFNALCDALGELFTFEGMALFYYSGHGIVMDGRTYLATQDGSPTLPGLSLNDLLAMANQAQAPDVLIILDACYSGGMAIPEPDGDISGHSVRPGVTVLAAARSNQRALEMAGHGVFTRLVLGALKGGAADVRGRVAAASIYSYVEQALGPWDQRPVYWSHATRLAPIRYCAPDIQDSELRRLPELFPTPDARYRLNPSHEVTHPEADPQRVAIFKLLKRYQVARLLQPTLDTDLYFAAIRSHEVQLTPLGQFYHQLAQANLLGESPSFVSSERRPMPDPEVVARMFHEAYERLAPVFGYVTREETRVPWEHVPDRSRRLMIATAAEVLAQIFGTPASAASAGEPPERTPESPETPETPETPESPESPEDNDLSLVMSDGDSREASS